MGLPVGKGQSARLSDGEDCRVFKTLLIRFYSNELFAVCYCLLLSITIPSHFMQEEALHHFLSIVRYFSFLRYPELIPNLLPIVLPAINNAEQRIDGGEHTAFAFQCN